MNKTITDLIARIPEDFKVRQLHMAKESSLEWFDQLPQIIAKAVEDWDLRDMHLVDELSFNNVLLYAFSPDHGDVVVKIGHPEYELFFGEPEALRIYNGKGACKLHALDGDNRVMLLERLRPGSALSQVDNVKERIQLACNLLKTICVPIVDEVTLPSYEIIISNYFMRAREVRGNDALLIKEWREAEELFDQMVTEGHERVVNHGDYHYRNILLSGERYKVIDPKGYVGFGYMDTAQIINNELKLSHTPWDQECLDQIVTWVSKCTGYSKNLLSQWLYVVSVWRTAGDVLYIKSDEKKLQAKIDRAAFYKRYLKSLK